MDHPSLTLTAWSTQFNFNRVFLQTAPVAAVETVPLLQFGTLPLRVAASIDPSIALPFSWTLFMSFLIRRSVSGQPEIYSG